MVNGQGFVEHYWQVWECLVQQQPCATADPKVIP